MNSLLIATNNQGKLHEIDALLKGLAVKLVTPNDIGLKLEVTEDGETYADNAAKKAVAFATASGLISLADDSGLEVEALQGAPGLHSARYLPDPDATDGDRRAFLLSNLLGKPRPWTACFHSVVAIAEPEGTVRTSEGECRGEIIPEERGAGGFGYDRIFFLRSAGQTMAELSLEAKNRISHRAHAVINARPILDELFGI